MQRLRVWGVLPLGVSIYLACYHFPAYKVNAYTLQMLVETYAIDWNQRYPDNLRALEQEAKQKGYWHDMQNPGRPELPALADWSRTPVPGAVYYRVEPDFQRYYGIGIWSLTGEPASNNGDFFELGEAAKIEAAIVALHGDRWVLYPYFHGRSVTDLAQRPLVNSEDFAKASGWVLRNYDDKNDTTRGEAVYFAGDDILDRVTIVVPGNGLPIPPTVAAARQAGWVPQ